MQQCTWLLLCPIMQNNKSHNPDKTKLKNEINNWHKAANEGLSNIRDEGMIHASDAGIIINKAQILLIRAAEAL